MFEVTRQVYEFDEFRLDAARRQLLREGEVVPLYSKAFDLLLLLVRNPGRDLSKDEILETIWPGQILEESNLTVNISAVRRALGEKASHPRYLVTIPGHGYRFVAKVREADDRVGGVVIATQTISEITIEQEEDSEGDGRSLSPPTPIKRLGASPSRSFSRTKTGTRVLISACAVVVLISSVVYFWLRSRSKESAFPFQQISIKRLTNKGTISTGALSADGKLFVYTIPEGDSESLWLGHVDGGEPIQIQAAANVHYLRLWFTPNGNSVYYSMTEGPNLALYRVPVFGGAAEKVLERVSAISFGPQNNQFAFLRYDPQRKQSIVVAADASGANEREIAALPRDLSSSWHGAAWSPDGLSIAVVGTIKQDLEQLFIVSLATASTKLMTTQTWRRVDAISWLPNGSGIVCVVLENKSLHTQLEYVSSTSGETRPVLTDLNDWGYGTSIATGNSLLGLQGINQSNIWVAPAANLRESKQITFDSPGRNDGWNGLTWTPDGRIVYAADDGDGTTLWVTNADGSKSRQLIPSGAISSYPSVAAEGHAVVFHSNRSGHFAVWRSDFNGKNMTQVTGEQIAAQPYISPDGKWIVYSSNFDSLGELWRVPAGGGEPFRLTDKAAGWAQISPDSKFVACELVVNGKSLLGILSLEDGRLLKSFDLPPNANLRLGVHWTPEGKAVSYRDWANGIWMQNLTGGEPRRLEGLPEEKLFAYGWSADGKLFAFSRGGTTRDVVLIRSQ